MKFGHFDDDAREYVITTPRTPLPWINYLGSEAFFSLVSHTAGGYSFYKDAKLRRITRYRYNNVPADSNGRYYYIKEGSTIWNPGWQPTRPSWIFTSAATVWVTASSPAKRTGWLRGWSCSCPWATTARSTVWC